MGRQKTDKSIIHKEKLLLVTKYRNIKLKDLANDAGVGYEILKHINDKNNTITTENLTAIAKSLKITPEYLTGKQETVFIDSIDETVLIDDVFKTPGEMYNRIKTKTNDITARMEWVFIEYNLSYEYYLRKNFNWINCINELTSVIKDYTIKEDSPIFTAVEYDEISHDIEKIIMEKCKNKDTIENIYDMCRIATRSRSIINLPDESPFYKK